MLLLLIILRNWNVDDKHATDVNYLVGRLTGVLSCRGEFKKEYFENQRESLAFLFSYETSDAFRTPCGEPAILVYIYKVLLTFACNRG